MVSSHTGYRQCQSPNTSSVMGMMVVVVVEVVVSVAAAAAAAAAGAVAEAAVRTLLVKPPSVRMKAKWSGVLFSCCLFALFVCLFVCLHCGGGGCGGGESVGTGVEEAWDGDGGDGGVS